MDAKILPFPSRAELRNTCGARGGRTRRPASPMTSALPVEYGSGWYHEAAIKDHERSPRPKG